VLTASRKYYKSTEDLKAKFNPENGQIELFAVKTIVDEVTNPATEISIAEAKQMYGEDAEVEVGYQIEFPKRTDVLGRIAAQTAKQVIFQKVREAERENIFAEYNQRIGEVINTTVKRFESGDLIVEIGRVEAVLPRKEQSRAESYTPGERIRAVIKGVNRSAKGPQIVMSRTDPALLIKLFEQEVPEIYDGTVMIRGAVREAGDRAKVAVYSRERDVDPVGACVGMKGTRVQAIIRELRGEKIDIVEWSEDSILFVTNALSPAKVQRVSIVDDRERVMEVVVEDKQLSLAIGKKGQNVRLAAKLTGWRIDIKSEEEKRKEVEAQFGALEAGDPQAQMDALFPDTPTDTTSTDVSADLSAEADERSESAKAEADEPSQSAEAEATGQNDASEVAEPEAAEPGEAGEVVVAEEQEKQES
jgi:N utilization substance protein A